MPRVLAEHAAVRARGQLTMQVEAGTRAMQLLAGQKHALELATDGASVDEVLRTIAVTASARFGPDARAACFVLDEASPVLRFVASSGLPEAYARDTDGLRVGPDSPSCGLAVHGSRAVVVEDVFEDTRWQPWLHVARTHSIRACWSQPILGDDGAACGSVVVVHAERRRPTPADADALELLAHTAGLVVRQHRRRVTQAAVDAALREGAARFQRMADHAPGMTWVTDPEGNCTFLSRSWYEFTGQPAGTGFGAGWLEPVHPEDRESAARVFAAANRDRTPFQIEYRLRRPDGAYRWAIDSANPHFDDAGEYLGFIGSVIDITDRKLAEAELAASESRLRALFTSIDEGYCLCEMVLDAHGAPVDYRFLEVNPLFESMTGLANAVGRTAYALVPDLEPHWRETYARVALGGEALRFENGSDAMGRWFDVYATPVEPRGRFALVFRDVTARRRAENALRDANRRKDEFLATLSHELRNPLAPIRNAARILRSDLSHASQRTWAAGVIERQVHTMSLLLEDLLDVSRITRGAFAISRQPLDLGSVVDAAVELARPALDARRHALAVSMPPDRVRVDGDPLRLSQALGNLLTNAAKYTDAGGSIAIAVTIDDDAVRIAVTDTGIGLARESLREVFEMFSQVQSALDRSEGGLGIGLALVKGIVELHGGSIEAASEGLGRGSCFTISLPLSATDAVAMDQGPVPRHAPAENRPSV